MTKKQKIDLLALMFKMFLICQFTSIFIMEIVGLFRAPFGETFCASLIFSSIAAFLMYFPSIIRTTKQWETNPYRFSRTIKTYIKVPASFDFPYFYEHVQNKKLIVVSEKKEYIDLGKTFERLLYFRDYKKLETEKIVEISVVPDTRTMQHGGEPSFLALSYFLKESGLDNSVLPLDEKGLPNYT